MMLSFILFQRGGAILEKKEDAFVVPTLVICSLIVGVLVSLLGVYLYRNRSRARSTLKRLAADLEGQPTKAYEVCPIETMKRRGIKKKKRYRKIW